MISVYRLSTTSGSRKLMEAWLKQVVVLHALVTME